LFALAVFLQCSASSQCFSQGLLGKKYLSVGYEAQRPNSEFLKSISSWSHGVDIRSNLPISDTIDLHASLSTQSFDGNFVAAGPTVVSMDSDLLELTLQATKHFRPDDTIDPYASIGVGYIDGRFDFTSGGITTSVVEDDFGIGWRAGFEWRLTESSAIQTEIRNGDTFEDVDFDDLLLEDLVFEARAIHWFNDRLFGGFTIGTDFDDTDVALGAFLGIGSF
jgi:opacity protein-like surface antigen